MPTAPSRRGFTPIELVFVLAIVALLFLLPGVMKHRWNASGLTDSLNNVRQILAATAQYRLDNAGRVPMRASGYTQGVISGGWENWNSFGKNCNVYWQSAYGGVFDESAYSRPLNSYLQTQIAPEAPGYINFGSGTSPTGYAISGLWTFNHGTPKVEQRTSFEVKKCRSPGDLRTYQRTWPYPTEGISSYDDIGTSYVYNMKWWDQSGLPSNFTLRYDAGANKIRTMPLKPNVDRAGETFAWIHDSIADVAANGSMVIPGEFGGTNMSVLGFLSGNASYTAIVPGALSGPGYTFAVPVP